MGAWIEIYQHQLLTAHISQPHPSWVRGLKSEAVVY